MFDTTTPFRIQRVKCKVLAKDNLCWSDLMVVCAIHDLGEESFNLTAEDVIRATGMNRCWVYASLRKLKAKDYIKVRERHANSFTVSITGWSMVLLNRARDAYAGHNSFLDP